MKQLALMVATLFSLALGACGPAETDTPPSVEAPPAAPVAETAPAREATPTLEAAPAAGGGVCARATECCLAYAEAVGPAARGNCDAARQTQAAGATGATARLSCQISIDAWRQALEARGTVVPAACR